MLAAAAILLFCLLPSQVNGLITTDARCLTGYQWMFSSVGQSPCDIAAELATVCAGGPFNLDPLDSGFIYAGPTPANQNGCRCSSVYYSLLSACGYCQGRNYLRWTIYSSNCSVVYLKVYNQNIPVGVKVPAYAYQDVSVSDTFNITLAQSTSGVESSRLPQTSSSTPTPRSTLGSTSAAAPTSNGNTNTNTGTVNNTPAIIGGVVGGLVALGLIGALITFLVLRSKQKSQKYNRSLMSPPPGSPGMVYRGDNRSSYPSADLNANDPNRNTVVSHITGSSAQNHMSQNMPQNTGGHPHYAGMPEL